MRRLRNLLAIGTASLFIVGCGNSSSNTKAAPTSSSMVAATNVSGSGTTMAPSGTTMAGTTPLPVLDGPAQFDVRIGVDSGPKRVERVKRGSDVTLNISNPNAADEFHVHTVDMEQKVAKGAIATFNFKVDAKGTIEVESHVSNTVIITIEVV